MSRSGANPSSGAATANKASSDYQSGFRSMESRHKQLTMLRCKLLVLGDACTGKTALTQVYQSDGATYPKNYLMTVGVEFTVKQVPIPDTNTVVELYIHDCAGQSIFNQLEMNAKYFDGAAAALVVYDISSKESLQSCAKWVSALKAATKQPFIGALVGNKCEFRDDKAESSRVDVVLEDAQRAAAEMGLKYFEVSAAANKNTDLPFVHVATEFYHKYEANYAKDDEKF